MTTRIYIHSDLIFENPGSFSPGVNYGGAGSPHDGIFIDFHSRLITAWDSVMDHFPKDFLLRHVSDLIFCVYTNNVNYEGVEKFVYSLGGFYVVNHVMYHHLLIMNNLRYIFPAGLSENFCTIRPYIVPASNNVDLMSEYVKRFRKSHIIKARLFTLIICFETSVDKPIEIHIKI